MIDFRWRVPLGGHHWVGIDRPLLRNPEKTHLEWYLTDGIAVGTQLPSYRPYLPLEEHTALWRVFSELPPTREAILEFANSFGLLGGPASELEGLEECGDGQWRSPPPDPVDQIGVGECLQDRNGPVRRLLVFAIEPLSTWRAQIRRMKLALRLWEISRSNKRDAIREFIHWEPGREIQLNAPLAEGRIRVLVADEHIHPELLRFEPGKERRVALACIQALINRNVKGSGALPRVLWTDNFTRLRFYFRPDSLLTALWLQFAQAVGGDAEYKKCRVCDEWFEVSLSEKRTDARYCSNACRQKSYRKRTRKKARAGPSK